METPIPSPEDELFEQRRQAIMAVAREKLRNIKLKHKKTIEKEFSELLNASFALGYTRGESDTRKKLKELEENDRQENQNSGSEQSQGSEGQAAPLVHDEKTT